MKKILLGICLVAVAESTLWAQADYIIRQRARGIAAQNNAQQGVTPPPPGQPAAQPAAPAKSPAFVKLQTDLGAIKAAPATAAQKEALAQGVIALAEGAKPAQAAATKWAESISAVLAEKQLSVANRARLTQELDAILNPSKYPQAKIEGIYADIQTMLQEIGQPRGKAVAIVEDTKALAVGIR